MRERQARAEATANAIERQGNMGIRRNFAVTNRRAAVLKLSEYELVPPSPQSRRPSRPFPPLLIFRAKVGNTGILITARHRGNSVGPTNHGARPINSRPYCGREREMDAKRWRRAVVTDDVYTGIRSFFFRVTNLCT